MNKDIEKEFASEWAEKTHELLDECGFEKDNQDNPELPSTTKRSEALALQALLFVFVKSFIDTHFIAKEEVTDALDSKEFLKGVKEKYISKKDLEEEMEKMGYTFKDVDWGDGIKSREPVEDDTKSRAYAEGFNQGYVFYGLTHGKQEVRKRKQDSQQKHGSRTLLKDRTLS